MASGASAPSPLDSRKSPMSQVSWIDLVTAQTEPVAEEMTIMGLLGDASGMVLFVLVVLVLSSITCWFIIGYKWLQLQRASSQTRQFNDIFWQSKKLDEIYNQAQGLKNSPVSQVFQAGYVELRKLKGQGGEGTRSPAVATDLELASPHPTMRAGVDHRQV